MKDTNSHFSFATSNVSIRYTISLARDRVQSVAFSNMFQI